MSNSSYRSFIKDNATVIAGHVFSYMRGLIVMPIIIKSVGVTTYGGYVLLISILTMAFGLSSLGTGITARRFLPSAPGMDERRALFYPQFSFNVLTIAILSAGFVLFAYPHVLNRGIVCAAWVAPVYLLSYFAYSQGTDYFRYTGRVQYMTVANLVYPYLDILLILVFLYVYRTLSIDLLVVSTSLAGVLVAAPIFGVILRELGPRVTTYAWRGLVTDVRRGLPLVLNNIVDFTLAVSDRYLIALYLTVTDVGYYVPAYTLGSLIIFIPKAVGTAFPQLLARAVDGEREPEARTMFDYTIKIFLLLAVPFVFGCWALSRPVLTLLANEDVASRGVLIAPLVALGTLFYGLTLLLSNILFVRLQTRTMFHVNLVAGLSNVAANLVLLFLFRNIVVAAFTTLVSYVVAFAYAYVVVGREWKVDYGVWSIVKSVAASAVMTAVLTLVMTRVGSDGALAVAALCALGAAVYVACLFAFRTFSGKELLFLRRLIGGAHAWP